MHLRKSHSRYDRSCTTWTTPRRSRMTPSTDLWLSNRCVPSLSVIFRRLPWIMAPINLVFPCVMAVDRGPDLSSSPTLGSPFVNTLTLPTHFSEVNHCVHILMKVSGWSLPCVHLQLTRIAARCLSLAQTKRLMGILNVTITLLVADPGLNYSTFLYGVSVSTYGKK
jgi:hypothetical protein